MTFACTKSAGLLNSVSATLNTAAECARHIKTSPHVDSTARMGLISSKVFKFQQQTLKTSQDIISLTSIKLSFKKKTSTPTLLLTNLPSQAVLQPARYHRKTKKILTPPSMIGFPRPVPSQPRSRQGFGLPMSGTNLSMRVKYGNAKSLKWHSSSLDHWPCQNFKATRTHLRAAGEIPQCLSTAMRDPENRLFCGAFSECPAWPKITSFQAVAMLNDCKTRLWIPPSELHLAKSKSNATSLAKLASCTAILWTVDCKSANRYEFEANSMSNSWRFARAQAQGYNLCPACRIMAGWQGGNPFVWRASWGFLPSGSSTACTPSEQSASRFGSSSLPGQSRRVTVSLARREQDMGSRAGAEASKRISSARGWRGYYYSLYVRRPLPSFGLGGAAPGITVDVQHGPVPALCFSMASSKLQKLQMLAVELVEWKLCEAVKWIDGKGWVVEGVGYETEFVTQVAGWGWNFVPWEQQVEPESELVTAGSSRLLRKIGLEVPSVVDSIQSSTSCQGRWENVQETWQHCQVVMLKKLSSQKMHPH